MPKHQQAMRLIDPALEELKKNPCNDELMHITGLLNMALVLNAITYYQYKKYSRIARDIMKGST